MKFLDGAEIAWPEKPRIHARLPIYYKVDQNSGLKNYELGLVKSATEYFNDVLPTRALVFVEDTLAPIVRIKRNNDPKDPTKWGTLVHPEPANWPMLWAEIHLYPKWFESSWNSRKENLLRHEFAHLLGLGHAPSVISLMHPQYCTGWWPWRLRLLPSEQRAVADYWTAPSAAAPT